MEQQVLEGCMVAILATDGFEQSELLEPKKALEKAGALVQIISLKKGSIKGWNHKDWGKSVEVDKVLDAVDAKDFDALVLPGGVMNPDSLRMDAKAVEFVRSFVDAEKPIAAICHGPWTLIEAGGVQGHQMTSWPSLKSDLKNAGAQWVDRPVVSDKGLVTSRKPDDLPQFCEKMIKAFAIGLGQDLPKSSRSSKDSSINLQHRH